MGGMQALEWAYLGDEYVKSIIVMACGAQQSAWALGQNHLQRNLIIQSSDAPASLAAARVAAMMTYRSYASINRRFSRKDRLLPDANHDPTCQYAVQSYLNYQGAKFVSRFDANCYLAIMDKLDSHDLIRRPSNRNVCAATSSDENDDNTEHSSRRDSATTSSPTDTAEAICIRQPALIIGITSDTLYPPIEQRNMAESIPKAELHILDSEEGHDAFLLEPIRINKLMADFMYQHLPVIS
jgi:homoserine O-acetyltransferase